VACGVFVEKGRKLGVRLNWILLLGREEQSGSSQGEDS
jgi:hypothetical protein